MFLSHRSNCFQLFGFDVLIDEKLDAWLLEINFAPSMNTDSDLDLKVKGDMVSDLFNLVGINGPSSQGPASGLGTTTPTNATSPAAAPTADAATSGSRRMSGREGGAKGREEAAVIGDWEREKERAELQRGVGFECIFPTPATSRGGGDYHKFFLCQRSANRTLPDHIAA